MRTWLVLVVACALQPPAAPRVPSRTDVAQLALGGQYTCALHADGDVSCWGRVDGEDRATPIAVGGGRVRGIGAGNQRTCGLHDDDSVACWDREHAAQVELHVPPVAQLAGECLRTRAGEVWCRGAAWRDDFAPIAGATDARDVASASARTGCAVIGDDGRVACWRDPDDGARHDAAPAAQPIAGVTGATRVTVDRDVACALLRDGHVSCWGYAYDGELGRGSIPARPATRGMRFVPIPRAGAGLVVGLDDATAIAASHGVACAIRASGAVACWGHARPRADGWLSRATATPTEMPGIAHATAIAASPQASDPHAENGHWCVASGHDVRCWGNDLYGQLGNGWSRARPQPVEVPGIAGAVALSHDCAVLRDGSRTCWHPERPPRCAVRAGEVWCGNAKAPGVADAIAVADGDYRTCALRARSITCWFGFDAPALAAPFDVPIAGATQLAVGSSPIESTDCALHADGGVVCARWPEPNMHGGGASVFDAPQVVIQPIDVHDATAIATGSDAACALRADHTVACWGQNDRGQLGDGVGGDRDHAQPPVATPVAVAGIRDAIAISAGDKHACALHATGTISCWGDYRAGRGGDVCDGVDR